VKDKNRIKYLLERYVKNIQNPEEGQELFERLKSINDPTVLEEIFQQGWAQSGEENLGHLLSWEYLIKEREKRARKGTQSQGRISILWKWGIAASFLIVIGLVWWLREAPAELMTWQTGYGETEEIFLDDGTKVTLNANSRLVWNSTWKRTDYREAELTGEAYFEVSHVDRNGNIMEEKGPDESQLVPFKVVTADLSINVLGTAFNVLNRRGKTDVYLDNGKVKLEPLNISGDMAQFSSAESGKLPTPVIMSPGDMISFSSSTRDFTRVNTVNPQSFTEWKEGTLVFDNVKFGTMLDLLEDIYGKKFMVNDSTLLNIPVSFGVPYKNWETVTSLMELTLNVDFVEMEDNKVRLLKRKG